MDALRGQLTTKPCEAQLVADDSNETRRDRHWRYAATLAAGAVAFVVATCAVVWVVKKYAYPSSSVGAPSARQVWIQGELLCDSVRQDAGYIRIPGTSNGRYFYWFFESRSKPAEDPLVLWLSGGPGCSALWTLLEENGPCRVQSDLSTIVNPYSWNSNASIIYVDQPLLTGFSYSDIPEEYETNSTVVSERLYGFLQGFYARHPGFRQRELYLAGEGYAGQFIPLTAYTINRKNTDLGDKNLSLEINLKGVAIGNGLTRPTTQYRHYLDMGVNNSYGVTLASPANFVDLDIKTAACFNYIDDCQSSTGACVDGSIRCRKDVERVFHNTSRNALDIRQNCSTSERDCYATPDVDAFLNSPKVQSYLGVQQQHTATKWVSCNRDVSLNFVLGGDKMKDRHRYLGRLMDDTDLRVLVYAGDADAKYNWIGIDAWTKLLQWRHKAPFNAVEEQPFVASNGSNVGTVRAFSTKFAFVRVVQAGHLVARDQPQVALDLLSRFLRNETLTIGGIIKI